MYSNIQYEYNRNMGTDRGTLADYFQRKYIEWINQRGSVGSQKEFANFLGISPQVFSRYLNGKHKTIEDPAIVSRLAQTIGEEIYDVLNLPRPQDQAIQRLPASFRERIRRASLEVNAILAARGLTGESPEAEQITIQIFEKYGLKYTATEID